MKRPPLDSVENVIINAQIDALDGLKYVSGYIEPVKEEILTLTQAFELHQFLFERDYRKENGAWHNYSKGWTIVAETDLEMYKEYLRITATN